MTTANEAQGQTTAPATSSGAMVKAKTPSAQILLKQDLERASTALASMLPRHVTVERLIKVVLSATARNESLLDCTRASIVRAVMQSAELGLELGGVLGEAYLVPYKRSWKDERGKWKNEKQAQCIPGYRGYIKLARQGGVVAVHAHPVHAKDYFKVDLAEQRVEHTPDMSDEPGPMVAVYAIARLPSGDRQVDVMRRAEVEAIRRRSKTYDPETDTNDGPWRTDYEEMARKTVVRRLAKYLPLSPELARALEHEAELEDKDAHRAHAIDVLDTHLLPDEPKPRALALAEEIASKEDEKVDEPAAKEKTCPTCEWAMSDCSCPKTSEASGASSPEGEVKPTEKRDDGTLTPEEQAKLEAADEAARAKRSKKKPVETPAAAAEGSQDAKAGSP
jgi:recombination protein RecT